MNTDANAATLDNAEVPSQAHQRAGLKKRRQQKKRLQKLKRRKNAERPMPPVLDLSGSRNQVPTQQQQSNDTQTSEIDEDESFDSAKEDIKVDDHNATTTGSSNSTEETGNTNNQILPHTDGVPELAFTTSHGSSDNSTTIRKIQDEYNLDDEALEPEIDEDGELRYPAKGYVDGRNMVIEDQDGEILRTIKSRESSKSATGRRLSFSRSGSRDRRNSSLLSRRNSNDSQGSSTKSLGSLKRAISGIAMAKSKGNGDKVELEGHDNSMDPAAYADRKIHELVHHSGPGQKAPIGSLASPTSEKSPSPQPQRQKSKLSRFSKSRRASSATGSGAPEIKQRRSHKFHGYRLDDDIIVENEEGEIVGRYRVNVKKRPANEGSSSGTNNHNNNTVAGSGSSHSKKDNTLARALSLIGMKSRKHPPQSSSQHQQPPHQQYHTLDDVSEEYDTNSSHSSGYHYSGDLEKNEMSNDAIIPEDFRNGGNGKRFESKLKGFLSADPKKIHVDAPETSDDEDEYDSDDDESGVSGGAGAAADVIPGESEFQRAKRLAAQKSSSDEE
ncbi:unnamed protein product [Ambrosiozyma monospora]|uniref:Unnamed protein product n=1 Tax=Ambrosiozyma monospora TaxID=43982 RepID=A0ACB5TBP5_AMBMO|nr:unnamed protein product [Ambrosiozyma monospora]